MGLTSSLFSGVSGLSVLGNAMTVIGDNIANINTIGFKSSRVSFQDILSQSVATQSGTAQVGRGTALGDVTGIFGQGSFESTESPTDLAIGGEGFFIVRHPENENSEYYTRAGGFGFDKDGNFVNSAGYIVKGRQLIRDSFGEVQDVGNVVDIKLAEFTSSPEATDAITIIANLDAAGENHSIGSNALSEAWDGDLTADIHIGDSAYEYQTTVKVYDSLGSTHDITLYFDKTDNAHEYEFIVTCNPNEDRRNIFTDPTDAGYGLLGRGTVSFTPHGVIRDMTFNRFVGNSGGLTLDNSGGGAWPTDPVLTGAYSGSAALPANYTFTPSAGDVGTDAITVTVGGDGAGTFIIPHDYVAGDYVQGPDGMTFQFNVGDTLAATNVFNVDITAGDPDDLTDLNAWPDMNGVFSNQHFTFTPDFLGAAGTGMSVELNLGTAFNGVSWVPDALSTSYFSTASTTVYQTTTGYGAGDLQSLSVDTDGVITGQYSNGQVTPLFRVLLAKFQNVQGLFKEGGSLFRATRNSGERLYGNPGTSGLGSVASNSLEQSNVDIANEFVKMITTQRGFQANSKIVTTVDQMLADTINMKR
ncbi:MAG: flagellar hook-basal body complex protein [Deltaproteobacteria bacterium]|nr:flagellar hook-basal body complex protein [Deltaproteobacteria bacterium]